MDRQDLFDSLTIDFSVAGSRRAALTAAARLALALAVFGAVPWRAAAGVEPQSSLVKGCKLPGQKCQGRSKCCAKKCSAQNRCGCINKGGRPNVDTPLGPVPVKALCCSNKLHKLKGTCK